MAKTKTRFVTKLSNFNFWWTETLTLYQSILSPSIAFFLTLFKGYKCNKVYEVTPKKRFSWEQEKIDSNFTGIEKTQVKSSCTWFHLMDSILMHLLCTELHLQSDLFFNSAVYFSYIRNIIASFSDYFAGLS